MKYEARVYEMASQKGLIYQHYTQQQQQQQQPLFMCQI